MSAETKKVNEGVVSSISDTDLVMVSASNGGLKPISAKNFANSQRIIGNQYRKTIIEINRGDWVRIASCVNAFMGLFMINHVYNDGAPSPALIYVSGFPNSTISEGNIGFIGNSKSFNAIRIVAENNVAYIEVRFARNTTQNISVSLSNYENITLLDATISTASASNVLKTIEFSGGGITSCQSASYGLQCEKGGAHECRDYSADRQTSERYNDGCISGKRLADGHGCRSTSRMLRCERHSSQHSRGNRDVRDICGASKYILSPSNISNFFKKDVFENEKAIFDLEGDSNSKYRIIVTKRRKEVAL